jgi:hypothetical protein
MTADDYNLMTSDWRHSDMTNPPPAAAAKMLTATNEKVRVHPASPVVIVAVR